MRIDKKTIETTTRYRARSGKYRHRWDRLHAKHLSALRSNDLGLACELADAKYRVYCEWYKERIQSWSH